VLSYSGDTDARVPVTTSRYSINTLKLPINASWRPWYSGKEVLKSVYLYFEEETKLIVIL